MDVSQLPAVLAAFVIGYILLAAARTLITAVSHIARFIVLAGVAIFIASYAFPEQSAVYQRNVVSDATSFIGGFRRSALSALASAFPDRHSDRQSIGAHEDRAAKEKDDGRGSQKAAAWNTPDQVRSIPIQLDEQEY